MESKFKNNDMDKNSTQVIPSKIIEKSILFGQKNLDFIREETLPDIFRATCQHNPHKAALIFKEQRLTYVQLDNWSDAIAKKLNEYGIGTGDRVACYLSRGLELLE